MVRCKILHAFWHEWIHNKRIKLLGNDTQQAIARRASKLAKRASEEYKFNETHVLMEMISGIPSEVESASVDVESKSPLLNVTDSTFWDYVTMETEGSMPETAQGRSFAKLSMDLVDLQQMQ